MKPSTSKWSRMIFTIRLRRNMFSCMAGRRRSSQRCWRRTSSPGSSVAPGWKTGVSASLSTSSSRHTTSTSPVTSFGLVVPAGLAPTAPRTRITHSGRTTLAASSVPAGLSGPITTCVLPQRSRRSMKITPLWSRMRSTQPQRTTSVPSWFERSSPQVWVRSTDAPFCEPLPRRLPRAVGAVATYVSDENADVIRSTTARRMPSPRSGTAPQ